MALIDAGVVYLYMNELFPTTFRALGVGVVVVLGRLGGVLAPAVAELMEQRGWAPQISFGVVGVVSIVVLVTLGVETQGRDMEGGEEEEKK